MSVPEEEDLIARYRNDNQTADKNADKGAAMVDFRTENQRTE